MTNSAPVGPEVYDFRRPLMLAKEHTVVLQRAMETVARHWGNRISVFVGDTAQLSYQGVSVSGYDDHIESLSEATTLVVVQIPGSEQKGLIEIPAPTILSWIVAMLGGDAAAPTPERALTRIEDTLFRHMLDELLHAFEYGVDGLLELQLRFDHLSDAPESLRLAKADDAMVSINFRLDGAATPSRIALVVPVELLVERLGGQRGSESPVGSSRDRIAAQLALAPVTLELRLDDVDIRPVELLGMRVGDIIPLGQPVARPIAVTVEQQRIADAAVGASGTRLAFTVTKTKESRQ